MSQRRNRRSGVEDRWRKADGSPSASDGKGKRWRARYVDDEGHEHARGFAKKSDAKQWLDEITTAQVTGTYVDPAAGALTVSAIYKRWSSSQGHISAKTAKTRSSAWNSRVRDDWGHRSIGDIRTSEVRAWVATMRSNDVGVPTIENAFGVLRQTLGSAVEDRILARNPCDGVKLPKRQHAERGYLSHAQVGMLADAVSRNPEVVRFLVYTGLRWGEMAALRVQDFDMLRRRVNISRSVTEANGLTWSTPKTHERRSVPFPAALVDELAALMAGKGRDDLVFVDQRGNVLRNSNWRNRVFLAAIDSCQQRARDQRAKEIALTGEATTPEFPMVTPHDLRHTAASLAVSAGANVKALQRMLGHAKASMTLDVYTDLFDDDLDGVADALDTAIRATADALRTGS